jgi:hypothetical protein
LIPPETVAVQREVLSFPISHNSRIQAIG